MKGTLETFGLFLIPVEGKSPLSLEKAKLNYALESGTASFKNIDALIQTVGDPVTIAGGASLPLDETG